MNVLSGDPNGDGRADIAARDSNTGHWWVAISNGTSFVTSDWTPGGIGNPYQPWSTSATWVDVNVGDFDGNGKADIAGRYQQGGSWWVAISNGSSGFSTTNWTPGASGPTAPWSTGATWVDVSVGDFNGDGSADIAGRYLQGGSWWVAISNGSSGFSTTNWTPGTNSTNNPWSTSGTWVDVKVGDFNGDGKADITGRYQQGGSWWTALSTGSDFSTTQWAQWSTAATWVDTKTGNFAQLALPLGSPGGAAPIRLGGRYSPLTDIGNSSSGIWKCQPPLWLAAWTLSDIGWTTGSGS